MSGWPEKAFPAEVEEKITYNSYSNLSGTLQVGNG